MVKKGISTQANKLYVSLEKRLKILTNNLLAADITEKSIDLVKEIKELHSLLKAIKGENLAEIAAVADSKTTLAWEDSKYGTAHDNFSENIENNLKT